MNANVHDAAIHHLPENTHPATSIRKKPSFLFLTLSTLSAVGLILGITDPTNGSLSGLCLALGAIFFGLAFITKAFQIADAGNET